MGRWLVLLVRQWRPRRWMSHRRVWQQRLNHVQREGYGRHGVRGRVARIHVDHVEKVQVRGLVRARPVDARVQGKVFSL